MNNEREPILKIIRECREEGICDDQTVSHLMGLVEAVEGYSSGTVSLESLLRSLKEEISGGPAGGLALLVLREICSPEVMDLMEGWSKDPEPEVRIAYLKCAAKLFDEGKLGLDDLAAFSDDPSPKVRETLVSTLSKSASEDEVFSLLRRMLSTERRSSVRSEILIALSGALDREEEAEEGSTWRRLRRLLRRHRSGVDGR